MAYFREEDGVPQHRIAYVHDDDGPRRVIQALLDDMIIDNHPDKYMVHEMLEWYQYMKSEIEIVMARDAERESSTRVQSLEVEHQKNPKAKPQVQ